MAGVGSLVRGAGARLGSLVYLLHGPQGGLARTWTTRSMAIWVLVLLLGYLALYFL